MISLLISWDPTLFYTIDKVDSVNNVDTVNTVDNVQNVYNVDNFDNADKLKKNSCTFEAILRQGITKTKKNIIYWMSNMASKDACKFIKKRFCEKLAKKFSLAVLSLTIIKLTVKAQKYS